MTMLAVFRSRAQALDALSLLKGAGVDMSTPQPVEAVVRQFTETLDEMEELAK